MTNPIQNIPTNINLQPASPELVDLLNLWSKQLKLEFNSHHIGTIVSFDPLTQTAQATINYTKSKLQIEGVGNTTVANPSYPLLVSCPCLVMGGGGGYISFPIEPGDECLIAFNDRDIDNWFASGSGSLSPLTGRLHAFNDAIVIVGLRSLPNVIVGYDTDAVTINYLDNTIQVFDDSVLVSVGEDVSLELTETGKLEINNPAGEFVSALSQLFADIQAATTNTVFGPQPLIMPTFTTDLAVFNSFKG